MLYIQYFGVFWFALWFFWTALLWWMCRDATWLKHANWQVSSLFGGLWVFKWPSLSGHAKFLERIGKEVTETICWNNLHQSHIPKSYWPTPLMPKLRMYTPHSLDRNLRESGFVSHLFSISLLASKDGKPTFTLRIQQRITTSSPICVLMNSTGLTPNKGQQLSKWQDHIVDSLIRCPCSSKVFNSVGMPSKSLWMEVNWYQNFNR